MEFPVKKLVIFLFLFVILLPEKSYSVSPEDLVASQLNYAYANYLGTGVYSAADRTVQVYHLPFRYTIREVSEDQAGLRIRLPVTIGFIDFDLPDVIDPDLPDKFETLTFVPGIQYITKSRITGLSPHSSILASAMISQQTIMLTCMVQA